jgi:hypothetical protein
VTELLWSVQKVLAWYKVTERDVSVPSHLIEKTGRINTFLVDSPNTGSEAAYLEAAPDAFAQERLIEQGFSTAPHVRVTAAKPNEKP